MKSIVLVWLVVIGEGYDYSGVMPLFPFAEVMIDYLRHYLRLRLEPWWRLPKVLWR